VPARRVVPEADYRRDGFRRQLDGGIFMASQACRSLVASSTLSRCTSALSHKFSEFFWITDCSRSLSRVCSATSRCRRAFSSRSCFISCASLTSKPTVFWLSSRRRCASRPHIADLCLPRSGRLLPASALDNLRFRALSRHSLPPFVRPRSYFDSDGSWGSRQTHYSAMPITGSRSWPAADSECKAVLRKEVTGQRSRQS